jgi:hypothetical protein
VTWAHRGTEAPRTATFAVRFTHATSEWRYAGASNSVNLNIGRKPVSAVPPDCTRAMAATSGKASHPVLLDCLASQGIRVAVTYQPASRYWAFQWTETAIYVALALGLAGYCFWRIRRRLS